MKKLKIDRKAKGKILNSCGKLIEMLRSFVFTS